MASKSSTSDTPPGRPLVGVIMGSRSDWGTMKHAADTLEALGIPHEVQVVSAHRTPDLLYEYAGSAEERG
ncbi:MAG: 5-(carboxyamino)imidazole ribonucleotide mutase, partial [Gemmatimonadetes bacterium]|nr:5-(carboxyamino)imidazole ribonucleotide mutase [Gemmatimonadota bacterium]